MSLHTSRWLLFVASLNLFHFETYTQTLLRHYFNLLGTSWNWIEITLTSQDFDGNLKYFLRSTRKTITHSRESSRVDLPLSLIDYWASFEPVCSTAWARFKNDIIIIIIIIIITETITLNGNNSALPPQCYSLPVTMCSRQEVDVQCCEWVLIIGYNEGIERPSSRMTRQRTWLPMKRKEWCQRL